MGTNSTRCKANPRKIRIRALPATPLRESDPALYPLLKLALEVAAVNMRAIYVQEKTSWLMKLSERPFRAEITSGNVFMYFVHEINIGRHKINYRTHNNI